MNFKHLLSVAAVAAGIVGGSLCVSAATTPPKREMRSTWFTTHLRIDWPSNYGTSSSVQAKQKKQIDDYLDIFQRRGLNNVCFQIRAVADAMYESSYEPWSAMVSGTRGTSPGWDPLAYVVEECHKRGMECYAWINPFRQRQTQSNYTTEFDKDWANKGYILSYYPTSNGSTTYYNVFNPGLKAARDHVIKVIREIYTKYKIDGMLFDDYFYPNGIPENSTAADYNLYKSSGSSLSIGDWRRENINIFMRELDAQVKKDRPDLRFGVGPAGVAYLGSYKYGFSKPNVKTSDWQYGTIYSDPIAWLADGSIDFIAPQLYWPTTHSTAPFEPLSEWWSDVANHFNRHYFASIGAYRISDGGLPNSTAGYADISKQVNFTRSQTRNNAAGQIYYSSKYFDGNANGGGYTGMGEYLLNNNYQRKALTPKVTWKDHPTYSAPTNLTRSGSTLSWSAVPGAKTNSIIRYTVYAIPKALTIEQAQAADGDGIDAAYLIDFTYNTSFNTKVANPDDYWYAVCVFDGYGYEHTPAIVNYPMNVGEATTLVSPQNGATVEWIPNFTWTRVSNAVYALEIAKDVNFGDIVKLYSDLSTTSLSVDLSDFQPGTLLYWKVITYQTDCMPADSEVRTFRVPEYLSAINPTLVSPGNGHKYDGGDVVLTCSAISEASGYVFEVSSQQSFNTIAVSHTSAQSSYSLPTSRLGIGTWYWRVRSQVPHHTDGLSEVRSFTINSLDVGNIESGYKVKTDPVAYDEIGTLALENLWMRSVINDFGNYPVENDGSFNRGMVIDNQFVYVSGRSENSANPSQIYLRCYSLTTGEHIRDIVLSDNGKMAFYPCNDVIKDSAGNILISNLSIAGTKHIEVMLVDLNTGNLTTVASVSPTSRVDHVGVYGDVTGNDPYYVFAAAASGTTIYRWTVKNGNVTNTIQSNVTEIVGGNSTFGIAPKCFPLDANRVFIDGSGCPYTLYNATTGAIVDSFLNNPSLMPERLGANGACRMQMGNNLFTIFSANDFSNPNRGHTFTVARSATESWGITPLRYLWTIPEFGLGEVNSTTTSAPVDAIYAGDGVGYIAVMAVGNGISVYRVTDHSLVPKLVGDLNHDNFVDIVDLGIMINMIMGANTPSQDADLNGDGRVDITDAGVLVNIIVSI